MATPSPARQVLRFGTFELDLTVAELRQNGVRVKLQDQPFRVLTALLERPRDIVTREDLRERLWPCDTFVDFDTGLNAAIKKLRQALRDDADSPRFVETIPKRGYRFIAPVEVCGHPETARMSREATSHSPEATARSAGQALRRRYRIGLLTIGAAILAAVVVVAVGFFFQKRARPGDATARINSLAVLPLENLSSDRESDFYAEGMTDELITQLAKLGTLRVISRSSILPYEGKRQPLKETARALKVDAVVEGTVLRSDHRVRLTAQLIQVNPERHLWAESYDRDERDVLKLQTDLAQDIARQIRLKIVSDRTGAQTAGPLNEAAHEAYLHGLYWWHRRGSENERKGLQYFERAAALDPSYAPAWAGIANSYIVMAHHGGLPPNEAMPKAKAAAVNALAIDHGSAEAHTALALIETAYDWDYAAAEREFRHALELNPSYATAHHWYAHYLVVRQRFPEALSEIQQAHDLDPYSLTINSFNGMARYYSRDYAGALAQFRSMAELDPDATRMVSGWLVRVCEQLGDYAQAVEQWRSLLAASDKEGEAIALARAYASSGVQGYWRERLKLAPEATPPLELAALYAHLGDRSAALRELDQAFEQHSPWLNFIAADPAFDPLRADPRFLTLLRQLGL
jgi:TolB-like protein/DNA-binding winged helix-turn-helix (wHTH) protein/lipopolysaccharide biosynthesis regulator YciM